MSGQVCILTQHRIDPDTGHAVHWIPPDKTPGEGRWAFCRVMHRGVTESDGLLTSDEHGLIGSLADIANRMGRIIGDGPTREGDIAEMVHHIHGLQQMVMAQAAARAYPDTYRLLGGVVGRAAAVVHGDVPVR